MDCFHHGAAWYDAMTTQENKIAEVQLSLFQRLAYASPIVVTNFLLYPIQLLLGGMYAKYFGLSLTTIAAVILAARIFDAVTDPLIGYFSDRHRARIGTRKPWIVVGTLCLVVSSYFLFIPPENVSVIYFLSWYFAFYLGWTIIDIPHLAWGSELSSGGHEKTQIYSLRATCVFLGLALYTLVPMLPFFEGQGFTPKTLKWSVFVSAIFIVPVLILSLQFAPDGRPSFKSTKNSPTDLLIAIFGNKPVMVILAGYFFIGIAGGMYLSMTYILADSYLGIGEQLPLIFAISLFLGLLTTLLIYKVSGLINKVTIYSLSIVASIVALLGMSLLTPGISALMPFIILTMLFTAGNATMVAIVPSLVSDAADYGALKFGTDRNATYFASYNLLVKVCFGIGSSFGFAIAGWFGFDAAANIHSDQNVFGLHLAAIYIPALLFAVSLPFVVMTPINPRRHRIIQQRLVQLIERSAKVALPESEKQHFYPMRCQS